MSNNDDSSIISFFDPHFHVWDASDNNSSTSAHDATILFKPNGNPIYSSKEYEQEFNAAMEKCNISHEGGIFLEAMSVCFPDTAASIDLTNLYRTELTWAKKTLIGDSRKQYLFVPCASLEDQNILEYINELKKTYLVRGIRQIVNHEPSWPRNKKLGNLLNNDNFRKGFELLGLNNLSFDMQLNPHQYEQAIELIKVCPKTNVIINHLGTPTLDDLVDEKKKVVFWNGMKEFAALENVSIKISMLCYIDPKWDENEVVVDTVHQIISLFGFKRCAFASNYPVDSKDGWGSERLFKAFEKITKDKYSQEERSMLYGGAAKLMYKLS
jgi:predicted TIM-barrel fold metal-dependent hydrolase